MNLALYKKSQCCMQSANFADAVAALDRISMFAIPTDMVPDVMYQKALCNWLNGNAQTAATHIDEAFAMDDSAARGDVNLLAAMIYNECHRFEDGHAALKLWMGENGISSECAAKVAKLYRHAHKKRSETAAMLLSVIPGAGHFYAGKVGEGLLSMVMNAAVISFGVTQFMNTLYLTCFIGAGLPLTYTYEGAANRATELVAEGNTAHINSFNQKNSHTDRRRGLNMKSKDSLTLISIMERVRYCPDSSFLASTQRRNYLYLHRIYHHLIIIII